jgi:mannitol/fructose-specific phosphotransferase system IIA component (Ntr-type)
MISIADTLRPERIRLTLAATDCDGAIRETAGPLQSAPAVLDWDALLAGLFRSAPCIAERDTDFGFCLPHARTDAVSTMVMSIGISPGGILFPDCQVPVRYIFCIGVPKALATDYLRIVGLLTRILRDPANEAMLRTATSPAELLDELSAMEAHL